MNADGSDFLSIILPLLKEEGVIDTGVESKVVEFVHPKELESRLDLFLKPGARPASHDTLEALVRAVVRYSVKTGHPHFHNQLYAGVDPYGLAGAWLTDALNTNQYTFEVAPAFTLAEQVVIEHVLSLFGLKNGDGIFCPGGSISNMYGMVLARHKTVPSAKTKGMSGLPPLVAFTSQDAHYSILKASHWLGIGTEHLVSVPTDAEGRMIPHELARLMKETREAGKTPFFVNATAGTTVLGAFDPIDDIADVCKEFGVWLHVDAVWGGSLILSEKYAHLLKGIERVDSLSWNPHKMMGAPLQCAILLVKHKGLLHQCNSAQAQYLFQQDKFYDVTYDTGDKSVQCGRKVDAFKLWLMWRARGDEGLRDFVENAMECSHYFRTRISTRPGFRLVLPEFECTNVCFWYIPPRLRDQEESSEWWDEIHKIAPKIKERMIIAGSLMVGYSPLAHKGLRNFFRVVTTCQPPPSYSAMEHIANEIEAKGTDL